MYVREHTGGTIFLAPYLHVFGQQTRDIQSTISPTPRELHKEDEKNARRMLERGHHSIPQHPKQQHVEERIILRKQVLPESQTVLNSILEGSTNFAGILAEEGDAGKMR